MALIKLEPKDFIRETPKYPDFPYAEGKARIDKAKKLMSENEIDAMVLFSKYNMRYFFGLITICWEIQDIQAGVGIIPLDGEPILIVPAFLAINAQQFCWTKDIRLQIGPFGPKGREELVKLVADVVKEIGCDKKNIALEMGPMGVMSIPRPLNDIELFKSELPDARFVNGDKVIWDCRMVKSPLEIDRIRRAVQVVNKMHSALVEGFRPGMSEIDLEKMIRHVEVDAGDFQGMDAVMSGFFFCNLEKEGIIDCMGLDDVMVLSKNDYIVADLQHKHKGYWADIARVFQVGPITDEIKRAYEVCIAGFESGAAMIRPGVKANEVYKAAGKPFKGTGLAVAEMAGHGVGMEVHEPPNLEINNEMLLQEGMVLALEIWIHPEIETEKFWRRDGGVGMIGFEDQFVVTDKGCERIEGLDKSIIQVSHPIL